MPSPVFTTTTVPPDFWHLARIGVPQAREAGLDGSGIVVGMIDSGVDPSHPELAGKDVLFRSFDERGAGHDEAAHDFGTHGTHIAGLIVGAHAGVAPGATLVVAAVLAKRSGDAGHLAQAAAGLEWLLTADFGLRVGVDIINASFDLLPGYHDALYPPLLEARARTGTLLIGAIGNHGRLGAGSCASPGNYDITIGVGATTRYDEVASLSAWGRVPEDRGAAKPDLCAPGMGIWSAVPGPGAQYQALDGTSMASPLVAGAAALLLQRTPSLRGSAGALAAALLSSTRPLADTARAGRGILDLSRALSPRRTP